MLRANSHCVYRRLGVVDVQSKVFRAKEALDRVLAEQKAQEAAAASKKAGSGGSS